MLTCMNKPSGSPHGERPQVSLTGMSLWEGGVRRDELVRKDRFTPEYQLQEQRQ